MFRLFKIYINISKYEFKSSIIGVIEVENTITIYPHS